ncbi:Uncharacterised protein [Legionella sainthelensi]|nr:Uncharacterised protein [Legionella sainthelensi]
MNRADLSKFLIHWISGETFEEAFNILYEIISSEYIYGNTNNIKGGFCCICWLYPNKGGILIKLV